MIAASQSTVKPRVLVVDDNDVVRSSFAALFETLGCQAVQARSGPEALEIVAHESVSIVFLDYQMPEMTGPEVAREIRAQHDGDLPIIGMSIDGEPWRAEACLAAGMDEFIEKIADIEVYEHILDRWVHGAN